MLAQRERRAGAHDQHRAGDGPAGRDAAHKAGGEVGRALA